MVLVQRIRLPDTSQGSLISQYGANSNEFVLLHLICFNPREFKGRSERDSIIHWILSETAVVFSEPTCSFLRNLPSPERM